MGRIILTAWVAVLLLFPAQLWAFGVILGSGQVAEDGADYSHITFFWTADAATFDSDDCSDGDDSPAGASLATIDTTTYQVGTGSTFFTSSSDYYTFDTDPANIANGQNGRVGFYYHFDTANYGPTAAGMIRIYNDASNYIWIRHDGTVGDVQMIVQVGGTRVVDIETTTAGLSTEIWYWIEAYWDATNDEVGVIVYNASTGVEIDSDTDTDAYTGWATTASIDIGEYTGIPSDTSIDNIIFSSDPTIELVDMRNLTSAPSGACDD